MRSRIIQLVTVMIVVALGATACVSQQNSATPEGASAETKSTTTEENKSVSEQTGPIAEEENSTAEENALALAEVKGEEEEEEETIADAIKASGEGPADTQGALPGTQEFGLTPRQLRDHIEKVEALIAKCMREEGKT